MRNVFLFGAGASHASTDILPGPPPLGTQLFDEVLPHSATAQALSAAQQEAFRANFEDGMRLIMGDRPLLAVSRLYVDIAKYLLQFQAGSDSSYTQIMKLVYSDHNIYSTINYDLLIEDSLEHFDSWAKINTFRAVPARQIQKLHGSCNFLPDGINIVGGEAHNVLRLGEVPFVCVSREEAQKLLDNPGQLMPDMSLYMEGKENLFTNPPSTTFYDKWRSDLEKADRIIVCGVAVNLADKHIWNPLIQNLDKIRYFGIDSDQTGFNSLRDRPGFNTSNFHGTGIAGLVEYLEHQLQ